MYANAGSYSWNRRLNVSKQSQVDPDEASLLNRCRKQEPEAFGKFVDQYQSRVLGYVRRMISDLEESADITQEVFIKAYQHFPRFDGRSSVKTWLFKIAQHICIDRARKYTRTPGSVSLSGANDEGEQLEIADDRWQPDQVAVDEEMMRLAETAISSMSEKLRSVLLLHDREDMAYEEIAEVLGIPVGTVKSRLFLAREYLQQRLGEYIFGKGGSESASR